MNKSLIYLCTFFLLGFSACDNKGNEDSTTTNESELVHSEDLHNKHTDHATMSREDHLKLVKAEEIEAFTEVSATTSTNLQTLTQQYLQLKEALVASNAQETASAASSMLQTLKAWDGNAMTEAQKNFFQTRSEAMTTNLQQIVDNKEVVKQRDHFARISKHMAELVQGFDTGQGSLYYQFCPMAFDNKGGYWLSDSKEIRNPFYPEEMLTCGRVAREL